MVNAEFLAQPDHELPRILPAVKCLGHSRTCTLAGMAGTAPVVFLVTWMRSLLLINMVNLLQSIRSVTRG